MRNDEMMGELLLLAEKDDYDQLKIKTAEAINKIISSHKLDSYTILMLVDENISIADIHSDRLYSAAARAGNDRDILLILHSNGGRIEPAYLIGKTLRRLSKSTFVAAVPRRAKSAATLIALGADTIHMGLTSHLGPIDPQVAQLPAQALSNALETIAGVACRFPGASDLLANYLVKQMPMRALGYYHRLNESAIQYAERLLSNKQDKLPQSPREIAGHLVNHYKDHGFVIDFDEALQLLGDQVVKFDTPEYKTSDEIFQMLDLLAFALGQEKRLKLSFIGDAKDGLILLPDSEKSTP